ncbi:MAG: hypothetical protein AB8G77_23060 [Rhodothermales bacterium]
MNLADKTFRAVSNSTNGSIDGETEIRFSADEAFVIGNYSGGAVVTGHVLGKRINDVELELLYQGATSEGLIQAGKAHAVFKAAPDGTMHMYLDWQWLTGDQSKGQSAWRLV